MKFFRFPCRRPDWRCIALTAALGFASAHAVLAAPTPLYDWREPGGAVSYSQFPPPAKVQNDQTREVDTRSFTPAQKLAIRTQLGGEDAAAQADATHFRQRVVSADTGVNAALRQLNDAERALKSGREPRPGERRHNAGGGSRLLATYFERQRRLDEAVQQARDRLNEAYRLRDELQP